MELRAFYKGATTSIEMAKQLKEDLEVEEHRVMCVNADIFRKLCDLYPLTAQSLKLQGIKKRNFFMNCMKLQEQQASDPRFNPDKD